MRTHPDVDYSQIDFLWRSTLIIKSDNLWQLFVTVISISQHELIHEAVGQMMHIQGASRAFGYRSISNRKPLSPTGLLFLQQGPCQRPLPM